MNINDFYTEEICCICCRSDMFKNNIKHHVTDMDGCTWTICDDCWKKLKEVIDKEDSDND